MTIRRFMRNNLGFSLVEVMVTIGILGLVSVGTYQLIVGMSKEVSFLEAKLATSEFKNLLITAIGDTMNCTRLLKDKTFNASALAAGNPVVIPMDGITLTKDSTSYDFAVKGQEIDYQKRIKIEEIRLVIQSGANNRYVGNVIIETTNKDLIRNTKPISARIFVNTDPVSPMAAKNIITCGAGDTNNLRNLLQQTRIYEQRECIRDDNENNHKVSVSCPPGEFLLACHGGPGDQFETAEAFWILPNFKTETCTLDITKPACVAGLEWTEQRVIAICLPI